MWKSEMIPIKCSYISSTNHNRTINKVLIIRRTKNFHGLLGGSLPVLTSDAIDLIDKGKFKSIVGDKISNCIDQHMEMAENLY